MIKSRSSDPPRLRGDYQSALFGELAGVVRNVKQDLPQAGLIGVDNSKTRWAIDDEAVATLRGHRLDRLGHALINGPNGKDLQMSFHASRLDFRQVKYVVDQGKQVPPCAEHADQAAQARPLASSLVHLRAGSR